MEENERDELFNSLWPLNKLRWFQVEIFDQEKARKNLPWLEDVDRLGFKVNAITVRDEFEPQISGIMDLKDSVLSHLFNCQESARSTNNTYSVHEYEMLINTFRDVFNAKMKEINSRTIKTKQ